MSKNSLGTFSWMWRNQPLAYPERTPSRTPWPRLSIVTPSYNQGNFLEETIRSVLYQGYPNLEFIVIDGGSSDNSVEIIRKYQDRIAYWVSEKDDGQAHAVNKGLAVATGEIVGWINSDDVYTNRCFRAAMSAFAGDPELGFVYGDRILIDENSRVSGWVPALPFNPESTGYNISSETAFWRRHPDDPRLRPELRFAMDLDLFVEIFRTRKSACLDSFLGCFRCYSANKSSTMAAVCAREACECWEREFGVGHQGWKLRKPAGMTRMLKCFAANPRSIAIPYLYRRFVLGRRGL